MKGMPESIHHCMNRHKLDEEILKSVGGKTANNLINILQDFNDTDFEIQTIMSPH